jgi:predicted alpha/beta hydrolase family esterase
MVLLLPGWQNSGEGHWQSMWESYFGDQRVDQHDWMTPRRGDWMAQLEEAVLAHTAGYEAHRPLLLAAHSLGCHLVAAWAAHSQQARRVAGALLVAPPDTEQDDWPLLLPSWRQPVQQPLPFSALVLSSTDDPFDRVGRAAWLATAWGATHVSLGTRGHVNADSGLGLWPQGRAYLRSLLDGRP